MMICIKQFELTELSLLLCFGVSQCSIVFGAWFCKFITVYNVTNDVCLQYCLFINNITRKQPVVRRETYRKDG